MYDVILPHLNRFDDIHFDLFVRSFCTFKLLCLHPPWYFEDKCFLPLSTEPYLVRIGPSASETGRPHDPLMGLVANLTQVKAALRDPSVREVVSNIAPQLLEIFPADGATDADVEVRNAVAGLPSSSKPASPVTPSPPPPVESPVEPPVETKPAKPAFTPLPEKPAGEVNSATHRAAHARLVRRMEKINPASFPNMTKLWNGNRKDILGSFKKIVFQMVCANETTVPHCP